MKTRRSFTGETGFTLVESMMAIAICAIALSVCLLSFTMSMQCVKTGANQMAALHSARFELEVLRTNSLTAAVLSAGTHAFTNGTVTGTYTVTSNTASNKSVSVSVSYMNYINASANVSTLTLATTMTMPLHQ
jgi:prepilin-type N-terminal cleavage/methylation domain-containing protein